MGAARVASTATRVASPATCVNPAITVAGTSAGAKGRVVGDSVGVGDAVGVARVASSATRVNSAATVAGTSSVLPVVQTVISNAAIASGSANIQIAIRPFANKVIPAYPMRRQLYHACHPGGGHSRRASPAPSTAGSRYNSCENRPG